MNHPFGCQQRKSSAKSAGAERAPAEGHGGAVPAAPALPCLNTNNCNEGRKEGPEKLSAGHRKSAFALKVNVLLMIEAHGLEKIGFLTLTFARHVVAYKAAQKALHSLMTGVLQRRYPEYIVVMERMSSRRIHYHLLVVMAQDIRTGFDFAAVKQGDYRSASPYLRTEWQFWRQTAPKYGFGRTELLPIRKTAAGMAKYVGKYIAKHLGQRLPEDKGAWLVRYSRHARRAGTRFGWATVGAMMWRRKLGAFCQMLCLTEENYCARLQGWFGRNWVHVLRPVIDSIKAPQFYPEAEARASIQAAWLVAVHERERRGNRRRSQAAEASRPFPSVPAKGWEPQPIRQWASWIERTLKEEGA